VTDLYSLTVALSLSFSIVQFFIDVNKDLSVKAKDNTKDLAAECTQGLYKDLHFEFTVDERQIINHYNWAYIVIIAKQNNKKRSSAYLLHITYRPTVYLQTVYSNVADLLKVNVLSTYIFSSLE